MPRRVGRCACAPPEQEPPHEHEQPKGKRRWSAEERKASLQSRRNARLGTTLVSAGLKGSVAAAICALFGVSVAQHAALDEGSIALALALWTPAFALDALLLLPDWRVEAPAQVAAAAVSAAATDEPLLTTALASRAAVDAIEGKDEAGHAAAVGVLSAAWAPQPTKAAPEAVAVPSAVAEEETSSEAAAEGSAASARALAAAHARGHRRRVHAGAA